MREMDRRETLKKAGGGITALLAAGGLVTMSSQSAIAASGLTANDVTVETNDGDLNSLTITPDITVSWTGMEEAVATAAVTWYVKTDSTSETTVGSTPEKISVSTPAKDGQVEHTYSDSIDLLNALSASNFSVATDGSSENTDVTLSMDVELRNDDSGTIDSKADVLGPKTFTVTVTNESSSLDSSGTANTAGS